MNRKKRTSVGWRSGGQLKHSDRVSCELVMPRGSLLMIGGEPGVEGLLDEIFVVWAPVHSIPLGLLGGLDSVVPRCGGHCTS